MILAKLDKVNKGFKSIKGREVIEPLFIKAD